MSEDRTVVIVATLDTKGHEAAFVRDEIAAWGLHTILIDPGILAQPLVRADISREEVAKAAGTTLGALLEQGKKGVAIASQTEGLCNIVRDLYAAGKLDGIISIGGGQGTSIGTAAMRILPIGVPKLMLSPIASGLFQFGPYVGTRDICMMHSVTDILGINVISRPILRNAANAIAGMVMRAQVEKQAEKPTIAITMLGVTTPCVMRVKQQLEALGYEVVPFHSNGTGGPAMEDLIKAGKFAGVIDLSTHEIIDHQHGGLAGAPDRLAALAEYEIPAVISVGGNDYILFENVEKAPEQYRDRPIMVHNAQMTVFRPNPDEMRASAREMVEQLGKASGPAVVVIPTKGFSDPNQEGREMWGPEGNQAMIDELTSGLPDRIPVILVDAHINDPAFAEVIADSMARLINREAPRDVAARYPLHVKE
jgi:uncharacterized protein (UPF0261 family)